MKNFLFVFVLCFGIIAGLPAKAQLDIPTPLTLDTPAQPAAAPTPTTADYIAMLYHKMTSTLPDFDAWAENSASYKEANDFDKARAKEQEASRLQSIFSLATLSDPIVIQTTLHISPYSFKNRGFTIDGFPQNFWFGYSFGGQNYAVVTPGLIDLQWIPVEGSEAMQIDQAADANKRILDVFLYVDATSADKNQPMTLQGADYWLISGRVKKIALYALHGTTPLWEQETTASTEKPSQDLLILKTPQ